MTGWILSFYYSIRVCPVNQDLLDLLDLQVQPFLWIASMWVNEINEQPDVANCPVIVVACFNLFLFAHSAMKKHPGITPVRPPSAHRCFITQRGWGRWVRMKKWNTHARQEMRFKTSFECLPPRTALSDPAASAWKGYRQDLTIDRRLNRQGLYDLRSW